VIGAGSRIVDSYVGPFTSIAQGCVVTRSEVEFSVLMDECELTDVPRVEASLLGRQVRVSRGARRPSAHRLLLGDHSDVELAEGS
jgi:glucose-1-phosphate thymidylyltransferase